jgi:hypothetical protein
MSYELMPVVCAVARLATPRVSASARQILNP